jgi:hypothetical protein
LNPLKSRRHGALRPPNFAALWLCGWNTAFSIMRNNSPVVFRAGIHGLTLRLFHEERSLGLCIESEPQAIT